MEEKVQYSVKSNGMSAPNSTVWKFCIDFPLCTVPQTFLHRGNHWIWVNSLPCQNASASILGIWVRLKQILEYYLQIGVLLKLLIPSPFSCFHSGFPAVSGRWDKKGNPFYLEELCFFLHMLFKAFLSRQEKKIVSSYCSFCSLFALRTQVMLSL